MGGAVNGDAASRGTEDGCALKLRAVNFGRWKLGRPVESGGAGADGARQWGGEAADAGNRGAGASGATQERGGA